MRIPAHTEATILVQFDPAYQADLFSRKIAQPLSIIYKDHVEVVSFTMALSPASVCLIYECVWCMWCVCACGGGGGINVNM